MAHNNKYRLGYNQIEDPTTWPMYKEVFDRLHSIRIRTHTALYGYTVGSVAKRKDGRWAIALISGNGWRPPQTPHPNWMSQYEALMFGDGYKFCWQAVRAMRSMT